MAKRTLEDAVTFLTTKPNPMSLGSNVDLFAEAFADMAGRLANVEHQGLENKFRLDKTDTEVAALATRVQTAETERAQDHKRLDVVEKAPVDQAKRIDDLEKRVRTAEGAIGSVNVKAVKPTEPVKPFGVTTATPLPEHPVTT